MDGLIAAALRGEAIAPPPRADWPALITAASDHGVLPLLADAAWLFGWDDELLGLMRPAVSAEAALSWLGERELQLVMAALAKRGVVPLLIKGAHLAFTVYPAPDRRPRVDTDLLIRDGDRDAVKDCLTSLGYVPLPFVTGDVAFTQFPYGRRDRSGAQHTIDVHWRIAIPKVFADRLTYDDLIQEAVAVRRLGPDARAPAARHALLVACLHRTAHHGSSTRLLWLYDLHLLAAVLSPQDWDRLVETATARGLASVVVAGLLEARARLHTDVPADVLTRLEAHAGETDADMRVFLAGKPRQIQVAASDWQRIRGWRARVRFLREHLFPSPAYIRHRYGISSPAALPFLYGHRIVTGAVKWLR